MEFEILRCKHCGAMIEIINPCSCNNCNKISCCNDEMNKIIKTEDKFNLINYYVNNSDIIVNIDNVKNGQFLAFVSSDRIGKKFFIDSKFREVNFPYIKNSNILFFDGINLYFKKII